jgi:hypothetical protein
MGIIDDISKQLDKIPIWRRLQDLPSEVDELKSRIVAIEERLGDKWPADVCKFCGKRAARLLDAGRHASIEGIKLERWACSECGKTEPRHVRVR